MAGELEGKVALVTGASRGIGRAVAIELAREGADVAVNSVTRVREVEAVVAEVRALGRRSVGVMADVGKAPDVTRMIDRVIKELGTIDILVNNAGVESIVPLCEITEDEWDRVTGTNLKGEFLCLQGAARHMMATGRGGVIINVGSVQAGMALPGRTHYAPSKRALEALTANAAAELASVKVRVNCIHPGLIDTEMTSWVMKDPAVLPVVLEKIAMRRAGQPSEVARVAVFLASDDASYITGQTLYVDGGFRIL